ncbi:Sac2 family-domain-containing protein [Phakopsora pachyrhizi]|nr:Sac2 family-domain-containing protein [Phakopsora pachyrhizi]
MNDNNIQSSSIKPSVLSLLDGLGIKSEQLRSNDSLPKLILESFKKLGVRPEDYTDLSTQAAKLSLDIHQAYNQSKGTDDETVESAQKTYSSNVKEFKELERQIQSSGDVLASLASFLSQFQLDLSSVSTSIAELQSRSELIESRLKSRRLLESNLTPFINSTVVPPSLIDLIIKTDPGEQWLEAISRLEILLTYSKTSSLDSRSTDPSNQVAEKLRLVSSHKIRSFFINSLDPFRTSINTNLQITQSSILLKYQALFQFLQRHSPKISHDVQKAYVGTARWYFETGLRRYVRALEKIRSRGWTRIGPISQLQNPQFELDSSVVLQSRIATSGVILAYMAETANFKQSPETLFRSLSLVVADNSISEFNFVTNFFGQSSSSTIKRKEKSFVSNLSDSQTRSSSSSLKNHPLSTTTSRNDESINLLSSNDGHETNRNSKPMLDRKTSVVSSSIGDSESAFNGSGSDATTLNQPYKSTRIKSQTAVDLVWKQVIEPVLEYHKMFTTKFSNVNEIPDTTSLYSMIKLNESLLKSISRNLSLSSTFESHLMSIKLQLWPMFQERMNNEIESMNSLLKRGQPLNSRQKLTSSSISSTTINTTAIGGSCLAEAMREEDVRLISKRYVWFFSTIVNMGTVDGEESDEGGPQKDDQRGEGSADERERFRIEVRGEDLKVLNELAKLRNSLIEVIKVNSDKRFENPREVVDSPKIKELKRSFLNSIYGEILHNFTDGNFNLEGYNRRCQSEIAYWKESVWRTRKL